MGAMSRRDISSPSTLAPYGTRDRPDFVSTRVFDASRRVLFRAFMDADILARWWGPAGVTNTFIEFTPWPGGMWRFVMHGPDGTDHEMENEFVEVVEGQKIVFVHHQVT